VIAESGPPFGLGPAQKLADAEALGAEIGAAAQPNSKSNLKALLALSPAALDELANKVIQARPKDTASSSAAVVDGWVLPLAPQKAFATGAIQKVDLLIGLNGREFSVFRIAAEMAAKRAGNKDERNDDPGAALAGLAETVRPLYGSQTNEAVSSYLGEIRANPSQGADHAMNDMLAACPIGAVATLVNAKGQKVFVYEFNRTVPGKGEANLGAFHSLELPYVFGAFDDSSWRWLPVTDVDRTLAGSIQSYWINFAKTGNPNAPGLPSWPVWNNNDELFLEITKDGKITAQRKFSPHSCDLAPEKLKERLSK
jgi:para-nitrobenzyl esterase